MGAITTTTTKNKKMVATSFFFFFFFRWGKERLVAICGSLKLANSERSFNGGLYVFGDSLYDTGTNLYIDKGKAADNEPYGMTYFKRPAGRFSDGLVIPDFIAQYANIPFPEPYWNPNTTDFTKPVNFAVAGAGLLVETRPFTLCMKLQTQYFVEMIEKLELQYGVAQTKKLLSKSVLLLNIGANDYIDLYTMNNKHVPDDMKTQFTNYMVGNFSTHVVTMYKKGARNFAFQALAPMGCFPAFRQADGSCTPELNEMARVHNARVQGVFESLSLQLPGLQYSIYKFYDTIYARINNGPRYGFTENLYACCGSGQFRGQFTCSDKTTNFTSCSNPTDYLWFDGGHPTMKAYQQFAKEFWGGSTNVVFPRNLRSFFS